MANYVPLKNIKGLQMPNNPTGFQFYWEASSNDYNAHHLWVYMEGNNQPPHIVPYSQCVEHRVSLNFPYAPISLVEIQKIRFLIFTSDESVMPNGMEIQKMSQTKEFICEVCCGKAEISWCWLKEKNTSGLEINSDKSIPEGILYFEYEYGGINFQIDIPGTIAKGKNVYSQILLPALYAEPQLRSSTMNLNITPKQKKGFFDIWKK